MYQIKPIIPFIEGDGTGPDIWAAAQEYLDAAVEKAYNGEERMFGKKYLLVKKHLTKQVNGYQMKH